MSKAGIKDAIRDVKNLKKFVEGANQDIVRELVDIGQEVGQIYNSAAANSGPTKSTVIGKVTENSNKGYVALVGKNAVYDEFGTGEVGAQYPHPRKDSVNRPLNPYSSGPIVSQNINKYGRHYWFYKPMAGTDWVRSTGYTEGIPAGKQMYNTAKIIREIKKSVIEKHLNNVIKDFNDINKNV